jgi:fumarate reductase subunit D
MTPQNQQQQGQISAVGGGAETVREQDKVMLILSYLGILSLIPLLTVKDSEYVKWHAKQGLTLSLGAFVVMLVLAFVPIVGLVNCLLAPGTLVVAIMSILKALKGERWRIPVIADLSEKF